MDVASKAKRKKQKTKPIIIESSAKDEALPVRDMPVREFEPVVQDVPKKQLVPKDQTRMIHIRSLDALQYFTDNNGQTVTTAFSADLSKLGNKFVIDEDHALFATLSSAEIPFSFYAINANNNKLTINENAGPDITITITPGNYDIVQLISLVTTALNNGKNHKKNAFFWQ